jgi:hypothetical protein
MDNIDFQHVTYLQDTNEFRIRFYHAGNETDITMSECDFLSLISMTTKIYKDSLVMRGKL